MVFQILRFLVLSQSSPFSRALFITPHVICFGGNDQTYGHDIQDEEHAITASIGRAIIFSVDIGCDHWRIVFMSLVFALGGGEGGAEEREREGRDLVV